MMEGIEGGTAVVTGAASGIGRATAKRFAEEGASVVVADVDADGGRATVEAIREAGGEAAFVETDVSEPDDVEVMIEETIAMFDGLDFAHNNAGIGEHVEGIREMTQEEWQRTNEINLGGVWLCLREELREMAATDGGAIVNTSSISGLLGSPRAPHYAAAKHGVLGLTKSAAFEFAGDHIRVNAVCPGIILTDLVDDAAEAKERASRAVPLGRIGRAEEIADVVVRLCSEDASFVTGIEVPIDGGILAGPSGGR